VTLQEVGGSSEGGWEEVVSVAPHGNALTVLFSPSGEADQVLKPSSIKEASCLIQCISIYLPIYLCICLSIYLSIYPSIYLFFYLSSEKDWEEVVSVAPHGNALTVLFSPSGETDQVPPHPTPCILNPSPVKIDMRSKVYEP
jgi:hypothetical protein